jgi:hypothetical protein
MMKSQCNIFGGRKVNLSNHKLTADQKTFIAELVNVHGYIIKDVADFYTLGKSSVHNYSTRLRASGTFKDGGRPGKWDEISKEVIRESLSGEKRIQMNSEEYEEMLKAEAANSAERSGKENKQNQQRNRKLKPVNRRDMLRLEEKMVIETDKNPEFTTDAREKGCSSIRNAFSSACAFMLQERTTPKELQLNYDATQGTVGDRPKKKLTGKRIGPIKEGKSKKVRKPKAGSKGLTSYFIKSVPICNADGIYGPMVHIHADEGMLPDDIDVYEVDGIGLSMGMKDPAFLVFVKSRMMNAPYEEWYTRYVMMKFVSKLRMDYDLPATEYPCSVNADGEDRQVMVFANEALQRDLVVQNIVVDKPAAATTEITQMMDQETFITYKNFLHDITDDNVDTQSKRFRNVADVFAHHQTKMSAQLGKKAYKGMTPSHVRMGIYGQIRVSTAFSKTCTIDRGVKSFATIGQRPFSATQMLDQLYVHVSEDERFLFIDALENGADYYEIEGCMPNEIMDLLLVPDNDEEIELGSREGVTMSHRRSTRLTNEKQWRDLLLQSTKREASKRKKEEKEESPEPKLFKPYKPRSKKARVSQV